MHQIRYITIKHLFTKEACTLRDKFWLVYDISTNIISSQNYWNLKKPVKLYHKSALKRSFLSVSDFHCFDFKLQFVLHVVSSTTPKFSFIPCQNNEDILLSSDKKETQFYLPMEQTDLLTLFYPKKKVKRNNLQLHICKHQGCCWVTWYCCDFLLHLTK